MMFIFCTEKHEISCHQTQFLKCQNAQKYVFCRGSAPDPLRGSSPLDLLAALRGMKGSTCKGREDRKNKGAEREERRGEGTGNEGKRGKKMKGGKMKKREP